MKIPMIIYLLLFTLCTIDIAANTKNKTNFAREDHLDFLGIMIDGKIATFHDKIKNAGFVYNKYESNKLPDGQIKYDGSYNSHDVDLTVYYNRKTEIVYKLELTAHFDSLEMAQIFLDSCIYIVESNYSYLPDHDLEDSKSLHYRYGILRNNKDIVGNINIDPTYSYLIDEKGEIVGTSPTIMIVYKDCYNSSLLKPSTTEPSVTFGIIANDSCFFMKNYEWAMNYKKNNCYKEYKFRLDWLLNCYKYNYGVPDAFKDKEEEIEKEILSIDSYKCGTIKTAYQGGSDVFRFLNPLTQTLDFIIYELGGWNRYIKLSAAQIKENIILFDKLIELYRLRTEELPVQPESFRSEELELIPITYGEEKLSEGFGHVDWKDIKLTVKFVYNEDKKLRLEVFRDYTHVLIFNSINDIAEYRDFLKALI